ncbi:hypothetical protein OAM77_00705 [Alphaproteobacteria bacterium]|nr:hypothetical protein [Alphaproteobacteria bacterium]MDC0461646.1 hypothetical protein [Alphaproteobacteria bacterium]
MFSSIVRQKRESLGLNQHEFAEFVMDIHGMDVSSPPPLPTLVYDSRS